MSGDEVVEENVHKRLIGDGDVFEEAQRVLREVADERAGADLGRVRVEGAVGQAGALLAQVSRVLRRVVVELEGGSGEAKAVGSNALQLSHLAFGIRAVVGQNERHTAAEFIRDGTPALSHAVDVRIPLKRVHRAFVVLQAVANLHRQAEDIRRRVGGLCNDESMPNEVIRTNQAHTWRNTQIRLRVRWYKLHDRIRV